MKLEKERNLSRVRRWLGVVGAGTSASSHQQHYLQGRFSISRHSRPIQYQSKAFYSTTSHDSQIQNLVYHSDARLLNLIYLSSGLDVPILLFLIELVGSGTR